MNPTNDPWLKWVQMILPLSLGVAILFDPDWRPYGVVLMLVSAGIAIHYWRRGLL
jgi:hypothetical protein